MGDAVGGSVGVNDGVTVVGSWLVMVGVEDVGGRDGALVGEEVGEAEVGASVMGGGGGGGGRRVGLDDGVLVMGP